MICGLLIIFPYPAVSHVFQGPGSLGSRFFRVQVFQGPGPGSRSRIQGVSQGSGSRVQSPGSGSRVQGLGSGFRSSHVFVLYLRKASLNKYMRYKNILMECGEPFYKKVACT